MFDDLDKKNYRLGTKICNRLQQHSLTHPLTHQAGISPFSSLGGNGLDTSDWKAYSLAAH